MGSSCPIRSPHRDARSGFTLLEVCAALAVLLLILGALDEAMSSVTQAWREAASDPFGEAAAAFQTLTESLAGATLEPYEDYADATGAFRAGATAAFTPDHPARRSDLAFICGPSGSLLGSSGRTTATGSVFFVEPAGETQRAAQDGLDRLFNARGYFIEFGADTDAPGFLHGTGRLRWRLKEIVQPSESLQVFASTLSGPWLAQLTGVGTTAILAENIVALVVLPERAPSDPGAPLAHDYGYDSRDAKNALTLAQLPPRVRVVLAAIDEPSAVRLAATHATTAPELVPAGLFQDAAKLDADVAALDASLTAEKIRHRFFQRDLNLAAAAWSDTP